MTGDDDAKQEEQNRLNRTTTYTTQQVGYTVGNSTTPL